MKKIIYPEFYHIGLPKTGTTTIQYFLKRDPRVNLIYNRYFNTPQWYEEEYKFYTSGKINIASEENQVVQSGNLCKLYLAMDRIRSVRPDAKIIVTLREQREFLLSRYKYNFNYYDGFNKNFRDWLLNTSQGADYLSLSMYHALYDTINAFFPKEQIHFLFFEEMKSNQRSFMEKFYSIIGLSFNEEVQDVVRNKSLSESQLYILKKLNRFKLFKKGGSVSLREQRFFLRISRYFASDKKYHELFGWNESSLHKKLEKDFIHSNTELVKRMNIDKEKIREFGYLC